MIDSSNSYSKLSRVNFAIKPPFISTTSVKRYLPSDAFSFKALQFVTVSFPSSLSFFSFFIN